MGKSYTDIDIKKAKTLSKDWEVTETSKELFFTDTKWRSNIVSAQIEDDANEIIFILPDKDFVQVEKGDKKCKHQKYLKLL